MVFKASFNNICYIVAGETGENHQPAASHWQTFYHIIQLVTIKNVIQTNSMNNHWRLQKGKFEDIKDIQKPDWQYITIRKRLTMVNKRLHRKLD